MLKKAIILSLGLGLGVAIIPMISSAANSERPALHALGAMIDDVTIDSSNSSNYDDSASVDEDTVTSNDDDNNSDNDDSLSADATE